MTTTSDKPSNARPTWARATKPWSALSSLIAQSSSPDHTWSNNVNTICSAERRWLQFVRSSLGTTTHGTRSVNPTVIGITSDHGHQVVNSMMTITAAMTTATTTTTECERTTVVTDIAMNTIEQTMITTGMATNGMTGTNCGIHETIGGTLIEVCEIIDGKMTIVADNLLKPNRAALFPTINRGPPHERLYTSPTGEPMNLSHPPPHNN